MNPFKIHAFLFSLYVLTVNLKCCKLFYCIIPICLFQSPSVWEIPCSLGPELSM